jgi:threonine aldolase
MVYGPSSFVTTAMHDIVDLRSDTVTKPTPAMLRAMAEAPVGDDVLGDDPTVQALEEKGAGLLGKEGALFVPSGTMGNNIAIKVHAQPGDEILLDWDAHSMCYEVGAPAVLSAVQTRPFRSVRGVPCVDEIAAAIHKPNLHAPGTSLLVLENTHNRAGGAVIPLDVHRALFHLTRERGIKLHLDGARLFNAAAASGVPASHIAAQADTVSFCLSKGLGCPVGSLLCSTREFVEKARRVRKMFGGGMRQVGVLAAAGVVALDTMIDRLADDHSNALRLAQGIAGLPGLTMDLDRVQTNMIYFDTAGPAQELVDRLEAHRVRCLAVGPRTIRMVTHHDVDQEDIDRALAVLQGVAT